MTLLTNYDQYFNGIGGPKRLPIFGNVHVLMAPRPWSHLAKIALDNNGVAAIYVLNKPMMVVTDAKIVEEVLENRAGVFRKTGVMSAIEPVSGEDFVFTANDPEWSTLRNNDPLSQHTFWRSWGHSLDVLINEFWEHEIQSLLSICDINDGLKEIRRANYHVFSRIFTGADLDEGFDDFMYLAEVISRRITNPIEIFPPLPHHFTSARRRFLSLIQTQVTSSKSRNGLDFLSAWHSAHLPEITQDLAQWITNQLFAGVFSASSALLSALTYCSGSQCQRVRLAISNAGQNLSLNHIIEAEGAIREAMRLTSPVPFFARTSPADRDISLANTLVPPNTEILFCVYGTQRDPSAWSSPDTYLPERWNSELLNSRPFGSSWFMPFGRGPRTCLGQDLALAVIRRGFSNFIKMSNWETTTPQLSKEDYFFAVLSLNPGNVMLTRV